MDYGPQGRIDGHPPVNTSPRYAQDEERVQGPDHSEVDNQLSRVLKISHLEIVTDLPVDPDCSQINGQLKISG